MLRPADASRVLRRPSGNGNRRAGSPVPTDTAASRLSFGASQLSRHAFRPLDVVEAIAVPRAYSPNHFEPEPEPAHMSPLQYRAPPVMPPAGADGRTESPSQRVHQRAPPAPPVDALDTVVLMPRSGGGGGGAIAAAAAAGRAALRLARSTSPATARGSGSEAGTGPDKAGALALALATIARLEAELVDARVENAHVCERARADALAMASASRSMESGQGALSEAVRTLEAQLATARREHEIERAQAKADRRVFERAAKDAEAAAARAAAELGAARDAALAQAKDAAAQLRGAQQHLAALTAEIRDLRAERERERERAARGAAAAADGGAAAKELRAIKDWVRLARDRDAVERGLYCDEVAALEALARTARAQAAHAPPTVALAAAAAATRADGGGGGRGTAVADSASARVVEVLSAQLEAAAQREATLDSRLARAELAAASAAARAERAETDAARARVASEVAARALEADKQDLRARVAAEAAHAASAQAQLGQFAGDKEFCLDAIRQLRLKLEAVAAERDELRVHAQQQAGSWDMQRTLELRERELRDLRAELETLRSRRQDAARLLLGESADGSVSRDAREDESHPRWALSREHHERGGGGGSGNNGYAPRDSTAARPMSR